FRWGVDRPAAPFEGSLRGARTSTGRACHFAWDRKLGPSGRPKRRLAGVLRRPAPNGSTAHGSIAATTRGPHGKPYVLTLRSSGLLRASEFAGDVSALRDVRTPEATVQINAEFGFGELGHRERDYPGWHHRPLEPPLLWSRLRLDAGWQDIRGDAVWAVGDTD